MPQAPRGTLPAMRTLLAALGLTLALAAPAHAAVTIRPGGVEDRPASCGQAIVDGAAKPDVTFTIGGIDTPADASQDGTGHGDARPEHARRAAVHADATSGADY